LGPLEPARPGVEAELGEGLQDPVAEDGLGPERMSPADEVGRDAHTAAGADGADGPAQRLSLWTAVRREPPGGGEPAEGFVDGGTCQAGAFHQLPRVMRPLRAAEGVKAQPDPHELGGGREVLGQQQLKRHVDGSHRSLLRLQAHTAFRNAGVPRARCAAAHPTHRLAPIAPTVKIAIWELFAEVETPCWPWRWRGCKGEDFR